MRAPSMELFDYQKKFLAAIPSLGDPARVCLYYRTGAGKSLTAMLGIRELKYRRVVVIAPPSTHAQWEELGRTLGMAVDAMSHAKFRMKTTQLSRQIPVIADEFHMFGGQKGLGWRKLDTLARHLQAPLFLLSATPNYNDAERVYCVQHILDPDSCRGGFLEFLYQNCRTEQDRFSMVPKVLGFRHHRTAADYLAEMSNVFHVPDTLTFSIEEVAYPNLLDPLLEWGYNARDHRMLASIIERSHVERYQGLVDEHGFIHAEVYEMLQPIFDASERTLVFSNHASIAVALSESLKKVQIEHAIVTGRSPLAEKARTLQQFREGMHNILIGTSTLATGTDGLDKVCDTLVILDDTDDEALRRQLIGRIMPRGSATSAADKRVVRFNPA